MGLIGGLVAREPEMHVLPSYDETRNHIFLWIWHTHRWPQTFQLSVASTNFPWNFATFCLGSHIVTTSDLCPRGSSNSRCVHVFFVGFRRRDKHKYEQTSRAFVIQTKMSESHSPPFMREKYPLFFEKKKKRKSCPKKFIPRRRPQEVSFLFTVKKRRQESQFPFRSKIKRPVEKKVLINYRKNETRKCGKDTIMQGRALNDDVWSGASWMRFFTDSTNFQAQHVAT